MTRKQKLIACAAVYIAVEALYQEARQIVKLRNENKILKRQNELIGPQMEEFFAIRDRYITEKKFENIIRDNNL